MSSSAFHPILKRCRRLLTDYAGLLSRHQYLSFDLTSIEQKILSSLSDSLDSLRRHEQEQLDAMEQYHVKPDIFSQVGTMPHQQTS